MFQNGLPERHRLQTTVPMFAALDTQHWLPHPSTTTADRKTETGRRRLIASATMPAEAVEQHRRVGTERLRSKRRPRQQRAIPKPNEAFGRSSFGPRSSLGGGFPANNACTLEQVVDGGTNGDVDQNQAGHPNAVPCLGIGEVVHAHDGASRAGVIVPY